MEEEEADAYTAEKEAAAKAEQDRLKAEEEAKKVAEEAATAEPPKENKVTKYAGAFLGVVALIALAAGGGFYFYRQQMQKKKAEKEALVLGADQCHFFAFSCLLETHLAAFPLLPHRCRQ